MNIEIVTKIEFTLYACLYGLMANILNWLVETKNVIIKINKL